MKTSDYIKEKGERDGGRERQTDMWKEGKGRTRPERVEGDQ